MATQPHCADADQAAAPLVVTLVTRGSPQQLTGGHLYHQRLAEAAPSNGAEIRFTMAQPWRNPFPPASGVVVVDSITAWSVAPWLRRRTPGPMAAILHQPPGGVGQGRLRTAFQRPLDLTLYRSCDLLMAASRALGDALVEVHHLPAERVRVIEPGCDMPEVMARPTDARSGKRVAVLCVANWLPNKGILELLGALATVPADGVCLHLAGREDVDSGYSRQVRARLAEPDLRDRVVRHGPLARHQVAELYASCDVFVLPSYVETYGTVYGEALAAGLPTVGWAAGNVTNLVADGVEGCLVEPGDVEALGRVLERLSVDDTWRAELASGARRRGATLPTWDDTAAAFFGALRGLAEARG